MLEAYHFQMTDESLKRYDMRALIVPPLRLVSGNQSRARVPNGWISIEKYRVAVWLTPLISDSNEQLTGLDTLYFLMDIHPLGTLSRVRF